MPEFLTIFQLISASPWSYRGLGNQQHTNGVTVAIQVTCNNECVAPIIPTPRYNDDWPINSHLFDEISSSTASVLHQDGARHADVFNRALVDVAYFISRQRPQR